MTETMLEKTSNLFLEKTRSFVKAVVTSQYLALVFRVYIGYVFINASIYKIFNPAQFAEVVASYRMLPFFLVNAWAVILPWTELICGLFLIIGLRTKAAAFLIGAMLVSFMIGILLNIYWDSPISCGCFDSVGEAIGWYKIWEDTFWLVLTVHIFFFDRIYFFRRGGFYFWRQSRGSFPGA